jgi:hypothetical protein
MAQERTQLTMTVMFFHDRSLLMCLTMQRSAPQRWIGCCPSLLLPLQSLMRFLDHAAISIMAVPLKLSACTAHTDHRLLLN